MCKIGRVLLFILGTAFLLFGKGATALPPVEVRLKPPTLYQGGVTLLEIKLGENDKPEVTWLEKPFPVFYNKTAALWLGYLSADLREKPGKKKLLVKDPFTKKVETLDIEVHEKDYGVRRLTLPKKMVDLDEPTLKRIRKESAIMNKTFGSALSTPLWSGAFIRPVPGDIVGPFGRRSIINGEPRSPHTGVDFRGPYGTPVKAMNSGKVVLTGDHFFTGRLVVIDHGGGIQSMYFHMAKLLVRSGQMVKKGDVIGLVGSTGRATGPHLHLGVRVNGCRVDPLRLTAVSGSIPSPEGLTKKEPSRTAGSGP
jgi:hypothetical protein